MVLGTGKTAEQIGLIMAELAKTGANVLATRVPEEYVPTIHAMVPAAA